MQIKIKTEGEESHCTNYESFAERDIFVTEYHINITAHLHVITLTHYTQRKINLPKKKKNINITSNISVGEEKTLTKKKKVKHLSFISLHNLTPVINLKSSLNNKCF